MPRTLPTVTQQAEVSRQQEENELEDEPDYFCLAVGKEPGEDMFLKVAKHTARQATRVEAASEGAEEELKW